jgi:hypothetical protein
MDCLVVQPGELRDEAPQVPPCGIELLAWVTGLKILK